MTEPVFYKAVDTNNKDFTTGKTQLVLGEWMPEIEGPLVFCRNGYHVSTEKAETLQSGRENIPWPARLYLVETRDVVEGSVRTKVCRSYRAIEELPAWEALGPNGQDVITFLESYESRTPGQVRALESEYYAESNRERLTPAWDAAFYASLQSSRAAAWSVVTRLVYGDSACPATALVVRDILTSKQFEVLTEPWVRIVGRTWKEEQHEQRAGRLHPNRFGQGPIRRLGRAAMGVLPSRHTQARKGRFGLHR